jgi:hypothetical protein
MHLQPLKPFGLRVSNRGYRAMATRHDEGSLMQKLTVFVIRVIFSPMLSIRLILSIGSRGMSVISPLAPSFRGDSYRLAAHDNSHTFWHLACFAEYVSGHGGRVRKRSLPLVESRSQCHDRSSRWRFQLLCAEIRPQRTRRLYRRSGLNQAPALIANTQLEKPER